MQFNFDFTITLLVNLLCELEMTSQTIFLYFIIYHQSVVTDVLKW